MAAAGCRFAWGLDAVVHMLQGALSQISAWDSRQLCMWTRNFDPRDEGVHLPLTASVRFAGSVSADVLVNTTSVGMHPAENQSPVAASALAQFSLVFDAIYTPLETQLLKVGGITHGSSRLAATGMHLSCVPFIRPCASSIQLLSCVPSQDRALPASSHESRCLP